MLRLDGPAGALKELGRRPSSKSAVATSDIDAALAQSPLCIGKSWGRGSPSQMIKSRQRSGQHMKPSGRSVSCNYSHALTLTVDEEADVSSTVAVA